MNALKTMLQRGRRTCGWVMFKPLIRYLVLGLLLACVGAVRPEGAGNWADSRYFDVAHVRCPVALQVAAPQELRVRRLSGGTLTVSWQRLTPPFPGDALQAETEVLVVVDAGTDHLVAQVPLDAGRAVVKSVPRGQPLDVSVALIRSSHVISKVGVLRMRATQTQAGYGVREPREEAKGPMPSPTPTATVGPPVSQPPVSKPPVSPLPVSQPLSNSPAETPTATPEPPLSSPPPADPTATATATATPLPWTGTLALSHSRNAQKDVTHLWVTYSYTPDCSNNPQIKAEATDGTDSGPWVTTAASGSTSFGLKSGEAVFKTLGATVTLLCDGVTVVTKAINDPSSDPSATPTPVPPTPTPLPWTGTLTLSHSRADTTLRPVLFLSVGYTFTPDCSKNPWTKAVAGDDDATTATDKHLAVGSGFTTFAGVFRSHSATVTLICDGADVVTETIAAPE